MTKGFTSSKKSIIMVHKLKIQPITDEIPWDLLLTADPSRQNIQKYLEKGSCYIAKLNHSIVGVLVLVKIDANTVEIMNIAVEEKFQEQGIGRQLVSFATDWTQQQGAKDLKVGTGNSSFDELAFYQKVGFRMVGVRPNFFLQNYQDAIYENGIQCLDMIVLSRKIVDS